MELRKLTTTTHSFTGIAIALGIAMALVLVGPQRLDPRNVTWLSGDLAVYQAGWEFLRHQAWSFPPTWISSLDFPLGVSAAYLDVIPIVAVPLRLISSLLPADFQYLGLYAAACLILQAFYAFRLMSRLSTDPFIVLLGGLFFLDSPILLRRLGAAHFSLCSQWLLLAAFYYYFQSADRRLSRYAAPFVILAIIAGGITPYLAAMVVLIGCSALFRHWLIDRLVFHSGPASAPLRQRRIASFSEARNYEHEATTEWLLRNHVVWTAVLLGSTALSLIFFGYLALGRGPVLAGGGYMAYSMNLLSPFDPTGPDLLGTSIPVFQPQVFEGYNYLGLGVILLGGILVVRRPWFLLDLWTPLLFPLLLLSLLLTLLALSLRIALGQFVLVTLPAPPAFEHLLAIFRSSGRFFWPVHELLTLGAVAAEISMIRRSCLQRAVLAAALLLQFVDTLPLAQSVPASLDHTLANPLRSREWASLSARYRHLVMLPAWQCDPDNSPGGDPAWSGFVRLAARGGLTLNNTHTARISMAELSYNCSILPQQLLDRGLGRDTAYVLGDRLALLMAEHNAGDHYCRRIDGLNLCTSEPARAHLSSRLAEILLPPYRWGTEFSADRARPSSMLLDGWDPRLFPGSWSVGRETFVYVRPTLPPRDNPRLEMEFAGKGAMIAPEHPRQRVMVRVNGDLIGQMQFILNGRNHERTLIIPARLMHAGEVNEIAFEFPDAVSPRELGISDDERLQGIYVSLIRLEAKS